jgi:hypothetical protein
MLPREFRYLKIDESGINCGRIDAKGVKKVQKIFD